MIDGRKIVQGVGQARTARRRGLQHVDRALRVDAFEGAEGRRLLADDSDEMDDGVAAGHVALEGGR
jgi:hypothetical protein